MTTSILALDTCRLPAYLVEICWFGVVSCTFGVTYLVLCVLEVGWFVLGIGFIDVLQFRYYKFTCIVWLEWFIVYNKH